MAPSVSFLLRCLALVPLTALAVAAEDGERLAGEDVVADLQALGVPGILVCAGLGLVLLFFGWRLVVLAVVVGCAFLGGLGGLWLGATWIGQTGGWILGGVGALLGLVVGGTVHRLSRAAGLALLLGSLGAAIGALFDAPTLALTLAVAAGVVGFILGWTFARQIEAVATAITGAQLLGMAAYLTALTFLPRIDDQVLLIAVAVVFILALIPGLTHQLRSVRRSEAREA